MLIYHIYIFQIHGEKTRRQQNQSKTAVSRISHQLRRVAIFKPYYDKTFCISKYFSTNSTSTRNQITLVIRKKCKINC